MTKDTDFGLLAAAIATTGVLSIGYGYYAYGFKLKCFNDAGDSIRSKAQLVDRFKENPMNKLKIASLVKLPSLYCKITGTAGSIVNTEIQGIKCCAYEMKIGSTVNQTKDCNQGKC
jgi:hypothetical protein